MFDQESESASKAPAADVRLDEQPAVTNEPTPVDARRDAKAKQKPKEVTVRVVAMRQEKRGSTVDEIRAGAPEERIVTILLMNGNDGLEPFMTARLQTTQHDVATIQRADSGSAEAYVDLPISDTRKALAANDNQITFTRR